MLTKLILSHFFFSFCIDNKKEITFAQNEVYKLLHDSILFQLPWQVLLHKKNDSLQHVCSKLLVLRKELHKL